MGVLIGVLAAVIGGQAIGVVLGGLTIAQLVTLAQVTATVGVQGVKVGVAVNRELDRRFPCNKHCQRVATEANLRAMEQYGWRHPYVGGRHNP
jgi:hypothetical protein